MEQREERTEALSVEGEHRRGRKGPVIAGLVLLLAIAAGGGGYYYWTQKTIETVKEHGKPGGMPQGVADYVTASGTTAAGITEEKFELDGLDTELIVEEVYPASGDSVETGSKILKVTDESLEKARKELTRKAAQTELLYSQGIQEQEISLIEAKKVYDVTMAEAEYVESDYNKSLREAHQEIDDLEEKLEDARELYEEYYDGVYNDGYADEYEVAEKKALYEQNEKLYWDTLKKWNIKDKEVNNSSGGSSSGGQGGGPGGSSTSSAAAEDKSQRVTALGVMEDTYRAEKEAYEQALEDYNKAVETANAGLENAKAEYELLELQLKQAQIDYEKTAAACKADYDTKMAEIANAQTTYDNTVQKLEEQLSTLENDKEEAADNLAAFEEAIGDGYLYTGSQGSIVMVAIEAGDKLEPDTVVAAYSDPTIMTVNAAVEQGDIASIEVGEEAVVLSSENGNFAAVVKEINPISGSGSRASVTYVVTLAFTEVPEELSANETVSVCFGISLEAYEKQMQEMQRGPMPGGDS